MFRWRAPDSRVRRNGQTDGASLFVSSPAAGGQISAQQALCTGPGRHQERGSQMLGQRVNVDLSARRLPCKSLPPTRAGSAGTARGMVVRHAITRGFQGCGAYVGTQRINTQLPWAAKATPACVRAGPWLSPSSILRTFPLTELLISGEAETYARCRPASSFLSRTARRRASRVLRQRDRACCILHTAL